jgi:hypothetical protein
VRLSALHTAHPCMYVCMYVCSGVGFPMHRDLYVIYCTSPVNFKSADIPSHRDGTARPTYQRTAEPSPSPLGAWGSLTCSKSTTRVKRLKVPPGGLVPWMFPSLKIRRPPPGLNPHHSGHEVGTLPLDHGGRFTAHPLHPGRFLVLISVRGWVNPRAIMRLEGLDQLKNPMTSLGIEHTTFWLVAYCLNQLRYRVSLMISS